MREKGKSQKKKSRKVIITLIVAVIAIVEGVVWFQSTKVERSRNAYLMAIDELFTLDKLWFMPMNFLRLDSPEDSISLQIAPFRKTFEVKRDKYDGYIYIEELLMLECEVDGEIVDCKESSDPGDRNRRMEIFQPNAFSVHAEWSVKHFGDVGILRFPLYGISLGRLAEWGVKKDDLNRLFFAIKSKQKEKVREILRKMMEEAVPYVVNKADHPVPIKVGE